METLENEKISSFEVSFRSIRTEPVKFIQSYFDDLSRQLAQEKETLKAKIDHHFENLLQNLRKFQQQCESAVLTRNFAYYDNINESYEEKLKNLKETLLLYKTVELKITHDEGLLNSLASIEVNNQVRFKISGARFR